MRRLVAVGCDRIKLDELAWDALTHAELRYTLRDVALEPFACDPLVRVGSTINRRSTNRNMCRPTEQLKIIDVTLSFRR